MALGRLQALIVKEWEEGKGRRGRRREKTRDEKGIRPAREYTHILGAVGGAKDAKKEIDKSAFRIDQDKDRSFATT